MILGSVASLGMLLAGPLEPLGPFHLLGFAGAGFVVFPCIFSFVLANRLIGGYRPAMVTALFIIVLASFTFGERLALDIEIPVHEHVPSWISVFAFLTSALVVDLGRKQLVVAAIAAAAVCSVLSYGFSSFFLSSEFQFGLSESAIAITSGILAGVLAGSITRIKKPLPSVR
jgi:hypothetical protein